MTNEGSLGYTQHILNTGHVFHAMEDTSVVVVVVVAIIIIIIILMQRHGKFHSFKKYNVFKISKQLLQINSTYAHAKVSSCTGSQTLITVD
jgi:hypothetical protein